MLVSAHLLEAYTRRLRRASSAACCSLFLPSLPGGLEAPVLIHDGEGPPVPELESIESAIALYEDVGGSLDPEREEAWVRQSTIDDGWLVALPSLERLLGATLAGSERTVERRASGDAGGATPPLGWVGFRGLDSPPAVDLAAPPLLIGVGVSLAWQTQQLFSVLQDPVTGLPERTMLQAALLQSLHRSRAAKSPLSVLLVAPRNLAAINARFGRTRGDAVLREIADRLGAFFRRSDLVSRFGAAVFAVVLLDTGSEEGFAVTRRLLQALAAEPFAGELASAPCELTAGLACFDPETEEMVHPYELLRRADLALGAARASGSTEPTLWSPALFESAEASDRLSGIFTAEPSRDYRSMVLLWDTIGAVASHSELGALVADVSSRLFRTLRPEELALFLVSGNDEPVLYRALVASPHDGDVPIATDELVLRDPQRRLISEACSERRPVARSSSLRGDASRRHHAFPLLAQGEAIGCLYLAGDASAFELDPLNVSFLEALASQLAQAMARARDGDREKKQLRNELSALRRAIGETGIVHASEAMAAVLRQVERIAASDATVLLLGESGTGKEVLARSIHAASPRANEPFVVIDCGAVAPSLLEAELFGHERGAFTGAHERRGGRLAAAAGGTVLLDEIGELPVNLQSKLLRFVQEKQLVPVGGSRSRHVDARILAATHRELREEVEAGRFREDLYYRLNVVRVRIPPLRERGEDVVLLANHFVRVYSRRYDRDIRGLTRTGEEALREHRWPGNVRELQNRIVKAVLLCDRERIGPEELELTSPTRASTALSEPSTTSWPASAARPSEPEYDPWRALRSALQNATEDALVADRTGSTPLGTWLEADMVREALRQANDVLSAAAARLGVPESTLRRKRAKAGKGTGRPPGWELVEEALGRILRGPREAGTNVLSQARLALLDVLQDYTPRLPATTRAALVGVTAQTLRRWTSGAARRTSPAKAASAGFDPRHFRHLEEG